MSNKIHPTAIIDSSAEIDEGVEIGPYVVIGPGVKIAAGNKILSHCVIENTEMDEGNEIYHHCVIGARSQVIGDPGEGMVRIGKHNIIREATQVHRGSAKDQNITILGNENYIMSQCHIAHDCVLGNKITMASYSGLAGHCKIGDKVVIGGSTNVSQFIRIGSYAFTAGRAKIRLDLPPFMIAREYSKLVGPNMVGLKRNGFTADEINMVKTLYKKIFLKKENQNLVYSELETKYSNNPYLELFKDFMKSSKMGIMTKA